MIGYKHTFPLFPAFSRYVGSDNQATFFSNAQRIRIVYEILSTALYGEKRKGEVGVDRLVEEGIFLSAFPLHDVSGLFCLSMI